MTKTKFAALTAGLLARKGEATPSAHAAFTLDAAYRDTLDLPERPHEKTSVPRDLGALIERGRPSGAAATTLGEVKLAVIPPPPSPMPTAAPPMVARPRETVVGLRSAAPASAPQHRTAVSVRLDDARYLRLKLAGARFHRTSQDIVTRAIDAYLTALGTEPVGEDDLYRWRAHGRIDEPG